MRPRRSVVATAIALVASITMPGLAVAAPGVVVVTTTIQAAVDAATPGDTVLVPPGVYRETVTITKSGITIKGTRDAVLDAAGFAVGIRASAGPIVQTPGQAPRCPEFGLHDLAVEGLTIRNASFTGVLFRGVDGFRIRDGSYTGNEAYAIFPICSRDGLIDRTHVEGTEDGAIYVGDSWDVVVSNNKASASTVGIEIENSVGISVVDNRTSGNSAGIAVFSLPGLPVPVTSDIEIRGNTVTANDLPNPIPPPPIGGAIGSIPTGTGILLVATDGTLTSGNRVNGNDTVGIAVLSYPFAFSDPRFDPQPNGNVVRDNTASDNAGAPDPVRALFPGADLVHDGTGTGTCFDGNRFGASFPPGIEDLFGCQ